MRLTVTVALAVCGLLTGAVATSAEPRQGDEYEATVGTSLLVQAAMQQARDFLSAKDYKAAVRLLEGQLPKINGNKAYLRMLSEAYRGQVAELQQAGDDAGACFYQARLAIIDPAMSTPAAPATPVKTTQAPNLATADQAFAARQYGDAAQAYQQATDERKELTTTQKERWAYCRLYLATQQVNAADTAKVDWVAMEKEVVNALALVPSSPRLQFGQQLLQTIRGYRPRNSSGQPSRQAKRVESRTEGAWQVSESTWFRVYHHDADLAERALEVAEQARAATLSRWFSDTAVPDWTTKCDVYLYPTAAEYSRETGTSPDSPGHSSIAAERTDASRIHSRRIDLRVDDNNFLRAVLPHETTHVTIAGLFGPSPIPRWADEGLAVLNEPDDRVLRHLRPLANAYRDGRVFTVGQLMDLQDYPQPGMMHAFYGQGVAIVLCLAELKDARTVPLFIRDSLREGRSVALKRHYGLQGDAELDQVLRQYVAERLPKLDRIAEALAKGPGEADPKAPASR